jgi:SAM-dependent methyltransferase
MAYSLCNSLLCDQCGLLFLDIRFSDSELALLYQNYRDEAYTALREHYEPGYRARNEGLVHGINYLQEVENFLRPHLPDTLRVLDWGGDTGVNTPFKDCAANTVHVYDISGMETTGRVRKVSKKTASQNHYDLVVCSNVLEHVPYPRRALAEIRATMNPTTVLYIEVPLENLVKEYLGGTQVLGRKRHWHEHINFFSRNSLEALVTEMGLSLLHFQVQDIESDGKPYSQFMLACVLNET